MQSHGCGISIISLATAGLLASPFHSCAQAQNPTAPKLATELRNGGLEESADNQRPDNWRFVVKGAGTLTLDEEGPLEGRRSAKIQATAAPQGEPTFANLMQGVDAMRFRGKKVRFRAAVRTAELAESARVQLWFRVDRKADASGQPQVGAFDNMQDRPINTAAWKHFEIVLPVAEDAQTLVVGVFVIGLGKVWFDDASLQVASSDTPSTEMAPDQRDSRMPSLPPPVQKAFLDAESAPRQPFFTNWLWLALVAIMFSALAMLGPLPSSNTELGSAPAEPCDLGLLRKYALRFAVVYWGLYCLETMLSMIPWIGPALGRGWGLAIGYVVHGVARHCFGMQGELVPPNGSGDTTFNYLSILSMFAIAICGACLWSFADQRRTDYALARDLFRTFLRYALALSMIGYGLAKVSFEGNQFPLVSTFRLDQTWGASSPMGVLWGFMGSSRPYTIFAGLGEVAAAVLLIWRRTSLLGAIIAFGVMLNVMMLNYCYDVPVKIYSTHLVLMAIMIMLPEAPRLLNVFLLNRPSRFLSSVWPKSKLAWPQTAIKLVVIGYFFGLPLAMQVWEIPRRLKAMKARPESEVAGNKYRLTRRGFRWINEVPFNR